MEMLRMRQESEMTEAMKQALEALKGYRRETNEAAITALRAAIAEASMQRLTDVQQDMDCYGDGNVYRGQRSSDSQTQTIYVQEPVAWMVTTEMQDGTRQTYPLTGRYKDVCDACDFGDPIPLYTHPPRREWVGLTDEEVRDIFTKMEWWKPFARAIEAKLKEKNDG
jgi:hypothetical protein